MVALLMIKKYLLSKNPLHQSSFLSISKMFKSKKSYTSYITIAKQAVCLTSGVLGKNYLQIIAFAIGSGGVEGRISHSTTKSYCKLIVVEQEEKSPALQLKLLMRAMSKVVRKRPADINISIY